MTTSTPAKSSTRIVPESSAERAAETLTNIAGESPNTTGEAPTNAAGESHTNTTIEYPTYIASKYLTITPGGRIPREPLEFRLVCRELLHIQSRIGLRSFARHSQ
jgi:hypothetical protein